MDPVSRRSFLLRGSAGLAGAAAVGSGGLVAVVGSAAAASGAPLSDDEVAALDGPVLVHVRDAATGEVAVLVGDREVTFTDRTLVATLLRAGR
jgi:hypothetical protein